MADIKITLETLYDILRNEKKREDLQSLEGTFFLDVVSYLREKTNLLNDQNQSDDIFAAGEKEKLDYELRSIKRILKEIYEKREKKIIDIALNKSRTGSDIIDTAAMLREEKDFYDQILGLLDYHRRGVLLNIFKGELPAILAKPVFSKETRSNQPVIEKKKDNAEKVKDAPHPGNEPTTDKSTKPNNESSELSDVTKVRFIHPMPSFVWKDMKEYGPYDVGEELEIFSEVAELLVRKKRAEKV